MKTKLVLLFSFFCLLFSAQTYTFDYMLEIDETINSNHLTEKSIKKVAINSIDNSYILKLSNDGLANLYDTKTKKLHHLKLSSTNKCGVTIFDYISTFSNPIIEKERFYTVNKNQENEYLIQSFGDDKKSILLVETTIKVKELPSPTKGLLIINGGNTLEKRNGLQAELRKYLDSNKDYIIDKEKMAFGTDNFATYKFKSAIKVNYSIIIPTTDGK